MKNRSFCISGLNCLAILAAFWPLVPQFIHAQEIEVALATPASPVSKDQAAMGGSVEVDGSLMVNAPAVEGLPVAPDAAMPDDARLDAARFDASMVESARVETGSAGGADFLAGFDGGNAKKTREKKPVESEIATNGMISYGDHKLFGAAVRCNLWVAGVEYDRHFWPNVLKARMDYVVEFLPFVQLSEPVLADFWGNPLSPNNKLVHGIGLSPFGFRALWRDGRRVKPFLTGKAGGVVFPIKVLSPNASYANLAFQGEFGLEIRLTKNVELRADPFTYFHFSNAFIVASNPGLDELAAKVGISYHINR
jgi:hypothetical protein